MIQPWFSNKILLEMGTLTCNHSISAVSEIYYGWKISFWDREVWLVRATMKSCIAARCISTMNSKSRLIKSVIKSKFLFNEVKRMVFTEMDKLQEKKNEWMIWYDTCFKYSETGITFFQNTDFKGIKFSKLIRSYIIKSIYFIYV